MSVGGVDGQASGNALLRKLGHFEVLPAADEEALARLSSERVRRFGPREDIAREGDVPRDVLVMLSGWAFRYKQLEDGRRQILGLFLPGDICDLNVFVLRQRDHSLAALTPVTLAAISADAFNATIEHHPRILRSLWWDSLVSIAIQREWAVNLGQRTAFERMGHLCCEVFLRMRAVGLTDGTSCELPMTQAELADATGLSTVHVNRILQDMRAAELITLRDRTLTILDLPTLMSVSLFNPSYLHLG